MKGKVVVVTLHHNAFRVLRGIENGTVVHKSLAKSLGDSGDWERRDNSV